VLELMRQLAHDHNRAVAVVTHDSRIADLGDRVVRIEDGAVSSVKDLRQPEPALLSSIPSFHSDLQSIIARPL
jgi:ABC-type lipoprotein export system ATPase subunit